MARTRTQIKDLVHYHTGRTKSALENSLCDSALKLAIQAHPFWESITDPYNDFTLTEDATSQNIEVSSVAPEHVLTARILETSGSMNKPLKIKNRVWWDANVINQEDNTKGWPTYCMHIGSNMYFDRPLEDGWTLRLRLSLPKTFTADSTECPIKCLDVFVEQYVTAEVFASIEQMDSYWIWRRKAVGSKFDEGVIGGSLLRAINFDKHGLGEDYKVQTSPFERAREGISVLNNIQFRDSDGVLGNSPNYGNTEIWF